MTSIAGFRGERWVRIMADYCADGVWHRRGDGGDADDLPISQDLVARIRAWQARHDDEGGGDEDGVVLLDIEDFAHEGLAIAQAVKAALPEFTVIYFDEHKSALSPPSSPRTRFEYEVVLPPA